ncbi:NADH-quinone oxidoreductase subunit C [Flavobacterium agricola]|uniref:NADH-quinone oxidoreductase n=1 Tax=Flavobacterium agricola TaxID=2870839 RepID=A0ABY6LY40_9FLAO|nr:NADH-quinone oxidoreductase subunit C [Flavobacterium agricola]UYW01226.1 NADH-quinone oxidoreductase subunit C [Flavobacterium agricola]
MNLDCNTIQNALQNQFPEKVSDFVTIHDMLTFEVAAHANLEVMQFLKNDANMQFNFLTDVCGIHLAENEPNRQLCVVYHMHNWVANIRIRFKCFLPIDAPKIKSVVSLFLSANWQERETYDFYGIIFEGHPQLKRILNMDEMVVFPLRKEFPLEDGGRTDKDDRFFGRESSCV